jgi:hypothetical protein
MLALQTINGPALPVVAGGRRGGWQCRMKNEQEKPTGPLVIHPQSIPPLTARSLVTAGKTGSG